MSAVRYQMDNDLNEAIVTGVIRVNPAIDFYKAGEEWVTPQKHGVGFAITRLVEIWNRSPAEDWINRH